jgi:hypothetical protein
VILALLFTLLGNPSAGGAVGRPLLNPFFSALRPIFPQGEGLSVIRGIQYFGGHGIGAGVLHLTIWGIAGIALLAVAAGRGTRAANTATDRSTATVSRPPDAGDDVVNQPGLAAMSSSAPSMGCLDARKGRLTGVGRERLLTLALARGCGSLTPDGR